MKKWHIPRATYSMLLNFCYSNGGLCIILLIYNGFLNLSIRSIIGATENRREKTGGVVDAVE